MSKERQLETLNQLRQIGGWWWVVILFIVALLRVPNFYEPYWYGDEGFYIAIGHGLRQGKLLYAEVMDHKTPIIYWLGAVAGGVVGLKAMLFSSSLVGIGIFIRLTKLFFKRGGIQALSGGLFALATTLPRLEGNIFNGELMLMPLTLLAVWLFWREFIGVSDGKITLKKFYEKMGLKKPFIMGVLYGMAILIKVPAVMEMVAIGVFIALMVPGVWEKQVRRATLRFLSCIGAGAAIMGLLTVLWFGYRGTLNEFMRFGIFYNFEYIEVWKLGVENPIVLKLTELPMRFLIAGVALGLIRRLTGENEGKMRFSLTWLVMSLLAATLSLRPYPHYFLLVIPALCLTVGLGLSAKRRTQLVAGLMIGLVWVTTKVLGVEPYATLDYYRNFIDWQMGAKQINEYRAWFDPNVIRYYELNEWLKGKLREGDEVYIHGNEPVMYALLEQSGPSRYIVHYHVEAVEGQEEVVADLMQKRPKFIVDFMQDEQTFGELYEWLPQAYKLREVVAGVQVYEQVQP